LVVAVTGLLAVSAPVSAARTIQGTPRADVLRGTGSSDVVRGRAGDDRIIGGGGRDRLFGGAGKDRVKGGAGADRLWGDAGNDVLEGGAGRDRLETGAGKDRLACGPAGDTALADTRDRIGTDCERVLDAKTGKPLVPASDIPGAQDPGAPAPPGKVCHLETRTVLVLEGVGSQAHYVLRPQVVQICVDGSQQPGAPECSDGRDNDNDLTVDFPADRGCESAADTTEYPDPLSEVEPLLTSRGGFWWQTVDPTGVCRLYVFRVTPQGDRIGTQQAWFQNPFSGVCLPQTFAPSDAFTWSVSGYNAPPVPQEFTNLATQVRIQLVVGTVIQLWLWAYSAAEDGIAFTTGAPPQQPGAVGKLMWGCTSVSFPPVMRPPSCP
jgi:hypothetical protein